MPRYEIALAVKDAQEFGNPRKKEGDLVAVKRHPATWGRASIAPYFIIIVESSASFETIRKMCAQRVYRELATQDLVTADDYDMLTHSIEEGGEGMDPQDYEIAYKNRYSVSFSNIAVAMPDLGMQKLQDESYIYQPFKAKTQVWEGVGRTVVFNDIDTFSMIAGTEVEFVVNINIGAPRIWDKYAGVNVKP